MRDALNLDIGEVINKQSKLKTNYDDTCLELRHRSDQLRDVQVKTENLTAKFKFNNDSLQNEKQRNIEDNLNRNNHLNDLHKNNIALSENIKVNQQSINNYSVDMTDLKRKHE